MQRSNHPLSSHGSEGEALLTWIGEGSSLAQASSMSPAAPPGACVRMGMRMGVRMGVPATRAGVRLLGAMVLPLLLGLQANGCSGSGDASPSPDVTSTPDGTPTETPAPTPEPTPIVPDWSTMVTDLMTFWENSNIDETNGGYYTYVNRTGSLTSNHNKWPRIVSREIYGFTRAFQLTGDTHWLDLARHGVDWMLTIAMDPVHGGFYSTLDEKGKVLSDERTLFNLAYSLNGLAAYYEVTHDPEVGAVLEDSFATFEALAWDSSRGGYYNELTSDMASVKDSRKSFNSQVDMASAWLLDYYGATGRLDVKERLDAIGLNVVSHVIDPDGKGWIGEMFDEDWTYLPDQVPYGTDRSICGHNLKTVWVLGRLNLISGSSLLLGSAEDLLDLALDVCRDKTLGGIYDQVDRSTSTVVGYDGNPSNADQKPWWQQEQGIFASLLMEQLLGKSFYGKVHDATVQFYLRYFPDPEYGEVFATVYGDGRPKDVTKGNDTKGAYHSTETAWFSLLYQRFLDEHHDISLYYHFDAAEADRTVRLAPVELPYGSYTIQDPALLDGQSFKLDTPSTVVIPAGTVGTLKVTYLAK